MKRAAAEALGQAAKEYIADHHPQPKMQIHAVPPPCPASLSSATGPCVYTPTTAKTALSCVPENHTFEIVPGFQGQQQHCCEGLTPSLVSDSPNVHFMKCVKK